MAKQAKTKAVSRQSHEKRKRFAAEYIIDLNATAAAKRAGYSEKTAHSQGPRLLEDAGVQAEIARLMTERGKRVGISADAVLGEAFAIATSDIGDVIESVTGDELLLKNLADLPPEVRRCIESISVKPTLHGIVRTVKMHSKGPALSLLADHLGLAAPKKHDVNLNEAGEELEKRLADLKKAVSPAKTG